MTGLIILAVLVVAGLSLFAFNAWQAVRGFRQMREFDRVFKQNIERAHRMCGLTEEYCTLTERKEVLQSQAEGDPSILHGGELGQVNKALLVIVRKMQFEETREPLTSFLKDQEKELSSGEMVA